MPKSTVKKPVWNSERRSWRLVGYLVITITVSTAACCTIAKHKETHFVEKKIVTDVNNNPQISRKVIAAELVSSVC